MIIIEGIQWFALTWVLISLFQHAALIVSIKYKWFERFDTMCKRCWTFWIVLGITWNPFVSAIAAFFSMIESNYNRIRL